jgi:AraC family transcriptional regulator
MNPHPTSAGCRGLTVAYVDAAESHRELPAQDYIRIILPGGTGATLYARHQAGNGRSQEKTIHFPEIAVVPPRKAVDLSSNARADLTIISLDREFCEREACAALGHAEPIVENYGAPDPFVRSIGNVLRSGLRDGRPPSVPYLESVARALAVHLVEHYGREIRTPECRGLAPHRLNRVLAIIDERLGEALHVDDLAAEVHMSPFHFARMFKHSTGLAPHMYITSRRMERAKALLAQGAMPLAHIALRVGYQTQAHFTGVFHAQVGMTPRRYRLRHAQRPQQ